MSKDLYKILGVDKSATDSEIKKAFKLAAKKYHPDLSKEDNAEEKFKEVKEAYAILSDPQKRQTYDQYGYSAFQNEQGQGFDYSDYDFSDIFSDIFGSFGGSFSGFSSQNSRANKNGPRHGHDMQMAVTLTFKEAIFGVSKDFDIKVEEDCHDCHGSGGKTKEDVVTCQQCGGSGVIRQQRQTLFGAMMSESYCPSCHGEGKTIKSKCHNCHGSGRAKYSKELSINFPKGVEHGAHMRVTSSGQGGYKGGQPGDLYIYVEVKNDDFFKREHLNIEIEMPVDYPTLVLGGSIEVPTVHGKVDLKIPHGSNPNALLKLKGQGVISEKGQKGDQIVRLILKTPKKISTKEREILESLRKVQNHQNEQTNIFEKLKSWF